MIPGKHYDPGTRTSRRPTPEKFAHLRRWVEPVVRNIQITSIEEIYNINEQLEQTANLFISNIISRVIAQIIGKFGDGFVTIESTEAGALHIHVKDLDPAVVFPVTLGAGDKMVGKIQIQGSGQTMEKALIDEDTTFPYTVMGGVGLKKHKITLLVLTVAAETDITLRSAGNDISGPMDFGGTGEPKGMVASFGTFHLECGTNEAFIIFSSNAVQVSGFVVYYDE